MKTILVTGGMGFIGSNFIRYILNSSHSDNIRIINVDKLTYAGNPQNLADIANKFKKRYKFYKEDICNFDAIETIIQKEDIEYIVNFAAESHVDRSIDNPSLCCDTNIFGTQTLLNLARKYEIKKFLQISTDEVYGFLDFEEPAFTEQTPLAPNSPYSASKASADMLTMAYYKTFNLPINITRCSNN
ncbi:MAG: dTDP-glucose 4,6-dehydratase, partial [Promethearchaeia archaeon]